MLEIETLIKDDCWIRFIDYCRKRWSQYDPDRLTVELYLRFQMDGLKKVECLWCRDAKD